MLSLRTADFFLLLRYVLELRETSCTNAELALRVLLQGNHTETSAMLQREPSAVVTLLVDRLVFSLLCGSGLIEPNVVTDSIIKLNRNLFFHGKSPLHYAISCRCPYGNVDFTRRSVLVE